MWGFKSQLFGELNCAKIYRAAFFFASSSFAPLSLIYLWFLPKRHALLKVFLEGVGMRVLNTLF